MHSANFNQSVLSETLQIHSTSSKRCTVGRSHTILPQHLQSAETSSQRLQIGSQDAPKNPAGVLKVLDWTSAHMPVERSLFFKTKILKYMKKPYPEEGMSDH